MSDREELIQQVADAENLHRRKPGKNRREEERSAWMLLRYLDNAEEEVNPTELCRVMNVTTPRITTILNDVEEKGYITRQISAHDRRRICVTLTEQGRERINEGKKRQHDKIARIIDKVGEEDARAFIRYVQAEKEVTAEMFSEPPKPL